MKLKFIYSVLLFISLFNSSIYSQWIQQTNGLQFWGRGEAIDACNNSTAIIAVDNFIYKTENSGNSWTKISYPASNGVDVSIIDKDHFWICTDNGKIFATTDGGANWSLQFYDTTKTQFMNYIKMFDLNNGIANGDAAENKSALFLTTTNGGFNWVSISDTEFKGGFSGDEWRRISFVNSNIGYFYISGIAPQQLFKTTDGSKYWSSTNYPNSSGDLIKFYNENLGLVVYLQQPLPNINYGICRTTDGGNSWETFNMNSKEYPDDIEFVPGHPNEVWYVDLGSIYFSSDTGRTWTEQNVYSGNLSGRDIVFTDSTHGWLLCDSGRVFYTSNNGGVVSGIPSNKERIHSEYLLMQNYPNPFNPTTVINYSVPKAGLVTINVYDILGREIKQLVNEQKNAGTYNIEFNASKLATGVYFYRMQSGSFAETKKLLLLK